MTPAAVDRRILVPVHDSPSSRAALRQARAVSEALEARLRIISILPVLARQASAYVWCNESVWTIDGGSDEIEWFRGDPLTVIAQQAAHPQVFMVIMGNGRHGALRRGFQAPLHERVLRTVSRPVLVVCAGADVLPKATLKCLPGNGRTRNGPRGRLSVVPPVA